MQWKENKKRNTAYQTSENLEIIYWTKTKLD